MIAAGEEVELMERSLRLLRLAEGDESLAGEDSWTAKHGKAPSKVPTGQQTTHAK